MGNGKPRASQAGTLCGEWICQPIHSIAVSGSMKLLTGLPSRLLHDTAYCTEEYYYIAALCTNIITVYPQNWTQAVLWDIMELPTNRRCFKCYQSPNWQCPEAVQSQPSATADVKSGRTTKKQSNRQPEQRAKNEPRSTSAQILYSVHHNELL